MKSAYIRMKGERLVVTLPFILTGWVQAIDKVVHSHQRKQVGRTFFFDRTVAARVSDITQRYYGMVSKSTNVPLADFAECPYRVLGLLPGVPDEVAKAAWRAWCKMVHPDHGGSETRFREVNEAWERISAE